MRYWFPSTVLVTAISGALAVAVTLLPHRFPGSIGIVAVGAILSWAIFTLCPWAVLPVGDIGGTIASGLLGDTSVRTMVILHTLPLVTGFAALATRRLIVGRETVERPPPSLGMLLLLIATIVAAGYGLAAGNRTSYVAVAAYQVAVIPVYYQVAMFTLDTARRRRNAAILFVGTLVPLTVMELFQPGRHGGLLSLLVVPPLVMLAGKAKPWPRAGLALVAAVLCADVVLASYRGIWLAAGLALAILLLRGNASVRRGLLAVGAAVVVLGIAVGIDATVRDRAASITEALQRPAGYRVPETTIGLGVFSHQPLIGAGLGQTTPDQYMPGFIVTDVGPVYHAFYVLVLANLGLLGLALVIWPILRTVSSGLAHREGMPLAYAALTCGFLAAALVSSPTDGHWELGLLPALTFLTCRPQALPVPTPSPLRNFLPVLGWR